LSNIFNKQKFASLPPDVQNTIREVAIEYSYIYLQSGLDTDIDAMNVMKQAGIEVYTWPDAEMNKLKAAAMPIWGKFIDDLEDKGLPGKEMVNEFVSTLKDLGENPPSVP
jgi:TRAP-type C4-dicarboxylate transport system substrate-binding protein